MLEIVIHIWRDPRTDGSTEKHLSDYTIEGNY